ncbi:MAG: YceI family protein [Cyclobacteriaceae bacterium]|nr:YceI family protein [Cyclobacteriaceae bacterium]
MRLLTFFIYFGVLTAHAQRYETATGDISFFSEASIEDISAINSHCSGFVNLESGEVQFSVKISEFEFEKSLMKQHFNEKYMESELYPSASFSGIISDVNPATQTEKKVSVNGTLTIHGQSNKVMILGLMTQSGNNLHITSTFTVRLADYKIKIPKLLWQEITEEVEVKVDFDMTRN